MNDEFILSVEYKREQKDYPARLLLQGYTYKIVVTVDNIEMYFERDEEGSFRVIRMPDQDEKKLEKIDKDLLHALTNKLTEILM